MKRAPMLAGLLIAATPLCAQTLPVATPSPQVALWPDGAPGSQGRVREPEIVENSYVRNVHVPSLTVLRAAPAHANGVGIIVIPGGGHRMLVWQNEGINPGHVLNRFGVSAFVLKYRLAREPGSPYAIERDAAADVRRAVRWVRAHAADYGVDPHRIGIMGFSAGGELVAMVADNPAPAPSPGGDAIDRQSARPDFQVLVYPGPLGIPATAAKGAPSAFLVAGTLDACCATPALALYQQLRTAGVSAELHLFADTGHAFNVAMHSERVSLAHWPDRLDDWLADSGWLTPGGPRPVPDSWTQ